MLFLGTPVRRRESWTGSSVAWICSRIEWRQQIKNSAYCALLIRTQQYWHARSTPYSAVPAANNYQSESSSPTHPTLPHSCPGTALQTPSVANRPGTSPAQLSTHASATCRSEGIEIRLWVRPYGSSRRGVSASSLGYFPHESSCSLFFFSRKPVSSLFHVESGEV